MQCTVRREAVIGTALIGGGSAGIGRATAARLARTGLDVTITGRTEEPLRLTAKELRCSWLVGDLAHPSDDLLDAAGRVDVLVLNAGGPPPGRVLDVDDTAWRRGLDLLLLGPLALARAALPRMAARGFGRVVVVTSTAVRKPEPDLAVSVVVRSAVTAAAKLMSLEHASSGVTVNCVAPGATATDRRTEILQARAHASGVSVRHLEAAEATTIPAGRAGSPDEVAAAIEFLASGAGAYVNGTVLTVDGGRTEAIW